MQGVVKRRIARVLQISPVLFRISSKIYHRFDPSFRSVSEGASDALWQAFAHSLAGPIGDRGDYYEFGLFRGYTFWYAQQVCRELGLHRTRFYGFDSFAGLPQPRGIDRTGNRFYRGQFAASENEVIAHLRRQGVDWSRTVLIPGFFGESLTDELKQRYPFRPVNVALIDCDLYESTCQVLAWLESLLEDGSILLFDDWRSFESEELGQARALREFLRTRPGFEAEPLMRFPAHGQGFVLHRAA